MFNRYLLALCVSACFLFSMSAQDCSSMDLAFPDISLIVSQDVGGTENRSGIAFNPVFNVYYSVNAGSSAYPVDAYSEDGTFLVNPEAGFDYRGLWYNELASTVEGNGFGSNGIFVQNLDGSTGEPTGVGATILPAAQPDAQSCGDIDNDAYQLIYYFDGGIHRYDRTDNSLIDTLAITGLPVGLEDINSTSIIYTGCPNKEYGLWDYTNKRILYIDKSTGVYTGSTTLPATAPVRDRFAMSYANNRLWLYDASLTRWLSYFITDASTSNREVATLDTDFKLSPNPARDQLNVAFSTQSSTDLRAEIYQLNGTKVIDHAVSGQSALDVSSLIAGTYFIRLVSAQTGQSTLTKTFVKQ